MAIQNFLSGGYYGKLGATVGQRWKNKRTIRTYVIPANPRTEKQQANRGRFSDAVTYAQMGMQMNYYATCFENPNFTKWNYRMKTARQLKEKGLTGLELIPLYPIDFVPSLLISEIEKKNVIGDKHISFYVPALTMDTDRSFSLMFEIYDESGIQKGLKLYVGYYYAANPGFLQVAVDDVNEINNNCKVRIVSNDDINSATDLIASPELTVKAQTIDIHIFDKTILELRKATDKLTILFAEPWKSTPTENTVSLNVVCVSDGKWATIQANAVSLYDLNGYCAVDVPLSNINSQSLPAFPTGSKIESLNVSYKGETWDITIENGSENYSDTDLTRTISATAEFDPASTGDIAFRFNFGGSIISQSVTLAMVCSGRLGIRTEENQTYLAASNGSAIVFTCTGSRKQFPMAIEGDYIKVNALDFIAEGVTYKLPEQTVNLRNAIKTSYWLEDFNWGFWRYGSGAGRPLEYMQMEANGTGISASAFVVSANNEFYLYGVADESDIYPTSSSIDTNPVIPDRPFYIRYDFNTEDLSQEFDLTGWELKGTPVAFTKDGIVYSFSQDWWNTNVPKTLGGWEE